MTSGMRQSKQCIVATLGSLLLTACGSPDEIESIDRQVAKLTACDFQVPGYVHYWVSPNGEGGANDKANLQEVHDALGEANEPLTSNVFVHVRGGEYYGQMFTWTKLHQDFSVVIAGCPGEDPIFDGRIPDSNGNVGTTAERKSRFLKFSAGYEGSTNITVRNLTVRNYYSYGIILNGATGSRCNKLENRDNVIEDCTFEDLGNNWDWDPADPVDPGYGAIGIGSSRDNVIRNNTFIRLENAISEDPDDDDQSLIHGVYAAHCATFNTIEGNSFDQISGDPLKFRDASNNNVVRNNYFNRCGDTAVINVHYAKCPTKCKTDPGVCAGTTLVDGEVYDCSDCTPGCTGNIERPSTGILVEDNVATFPHKDAERDPLEECWDSAAECTTEATFVDNTFELGAPNSEKVVAITAADFDQDGLDEVVVAFNYDGAYTGFTKIVSTAGSVQNRHLHRVLYANEGSGAGYWDVAALTSGDFNNDGTPELLTAFHAATQTAVYRGDGESYLSGATSAGQIYSDTSGSLWRVRGMAAANFNGSGGDEVISALEKSNNTAIYLGNGSSSLTSGGTLLNDTTSPYWRITAMGAGDFSEDGNYEVITAMHHADPTATYKVYSGNGETQITTVSLNTSTTTPFWETTATVGGDFNDDGTDELVTGMFRANNTFKLYRGNGTSTVASVSLLSSSTAFYVRALGAGNVTSVGTGSAGAELVSAIETPGSTNDDLKIFIGSGYSDYDDVGVLYSSYFND